MKIVQGDRMPIDEQASNVRSGKLKKQVFLTGSEGTPGNFKFGLFYQTGDFFSPRHRHNFDQFRFQIEGDADFDKNGTMRPDVVGYFPEGAHYGPQSSSGPNVVAVVQFGGPSGSGYLSQRQVDAAYKEMKKFGVFDKGVFRRNEGVAGRKNMDSFEATWEHANGRPMVYPKPQYADPILMNPAEFRWMPLAGAKGVEVKTLGTFTDCEIRCARYRVAARARFVARGRGIFLVLSGRGSVEGEPTRRYTTAYLGDGEEALFEAEEVMEIQLLGLPSEAAIGRRCAAAEESAAAWAGVNYTR
jgi:hypothetical protein